MDPNENIESETTVGVVKVLDDSGWNEITISVSCGNKIQPAQYEAAERNVYMSKKLRINAAASMEQEHRVIEQETRRMQNFTEAESARIVAHFCSLRNQDEHLKSHIQIFTKIATTMFRKTKLAFHIRVTDKVKALPTVGEVGVDYVLEETGEVVVWDGEKKIFVQAAGITKNEQK